MIGNETQILRTRLHMTCFRLELLPGLMQIELLLAEQGSMSPGVLGGELLVLHAQTSCVEVDCCGDIFDCEDNVVDGLDGEGGHCEFWTVSVDCQ